MAETKRKPGRPPGSKNKNTGARAAAKTKAKATTKEAQAKIEADKRLIDEIWGIILIAIGLFFFFALQFGIAGQFGVAISNALKGTFGLVALIMPWYIIIFGVMLLTHKVVHISWKTALLAFIVLLMMCLLNSERFINPEAVDVTFKSFETFYESGITLKGGGAFGMFAGSLLIKLIGKAGLNIFAIVVIIICLLLIVNTPLSKGIEALKYKREEFKAVRAAKAEAMAEAEAEKAATTAGLSAPESAASAEPTRVDSRYAPMADLGVNGIPYPGLSGGSAANPGPRIITNNQDRQMSIDDIEKNKAAASISKEPLTQEQRNNILKYMTDDSLFDRKERMGQGYGLDGKVDYGPGYGLTGEPITDSDFAGDMGAGLGAAAVTGVAGSLSEEGQGHGMASESQQAVDKLSMKDAAAATLSAEELNLAKKHAKYQKPSIELLNKPGVSSKSDNSQSLREKAEKLEETLKNFHVDAKVVQVTQGPAVTRYEIQPNLGVKVSSITRLADDIALNLEARSIRIEAPIPGKAAVGIEVENDSVNMVTIREIIGSREFKSAKSKITFAVGKDIAGNAIVGNLKDMPHLLIAGSTGSGKSVCINSIITSILYKANPDEVKLVLIDPKVVELGNYNGIPHLLIPVVTEPSKAAAALNWAVAEMNDRYRKFADKGVRDLESYNETVIADDEKDLVMPQMVIIIDELADLMMAAPSQVEESICRLAQMARAAGMHLIVATQRPSVDIITGVIKANIPSRIAFAVSSQFDSRTILDMGGAEKLVGKGDMLFYPLGKGKPVRIQGTFITDNEVHSVIEFVKSQNTDEEYNDDVLHTIERVNTPAHNDDADELLPDAIDCVVKAKQASVSMLQRRFRIGYNRAARIIDMMEDRGIIGPSDGSRPRQVLMSEEELAGLEKDTEDI